jgi:hypothetical protein
VQEEVPPGHGRFGSGHFELLSLISGVERPELKRPEPKRPKPNKLEKIKHNQKRLWTLNVLGPALQP